MPFRISYIHNTKRLLRFLERQEEAGEMIAVIGSEIVEEAGPEIAAGLETAMNAINNVFKGANVALSLDKAKYKIVNTAKKVGSALKHFFHLKRADHDDVDAVVDESLAQYLAADHLD